MLFFLEVTCSLCICIRLSARLPHGSRLLADPVTQTGCAASTYNILWGRMGA